MQNQTPISSHQDALDRVVQHFLVDGNPACYVKIGHRVECRYRLKDNGCAAGCLIPDEYYDPAFEGQSIIRILQNSKWFFKATAEGELKRSQLRQWFAGTTVEFLAELQRSHDLMLAYDEVESFKDKLRGIAKCWHLTIPKALE
jgi:hypothetical protein